MTLDTDYVQAKERLLFSASAFGDAKLNGGIPLRLKRLKDLMQAAIDFYKIQSVVNSSDGGKS